MAKKQNSLPSDNSQDNKQLSQAILDEMKKQGFLDEFIDKETGETLLEIQFSDEVIICNVEKTNAEDSPE